MIQGLFGCEKFDLRYPPNTVRAAMQPLVGGAVLPGPEIVFRPVYNSKIRNIFSKFSLPLFLSFGKIQP
jgi:hypothetical protein